MRSSGGVTSTKQKLLLRKGRIEEDLEEDRILRIN